MIILSIETATSACSVALHQNGNLIGCYELFLEKSHSEQLTVVVKNLLEQTNIHFKEIVAVAVSKGPGSYTGLRIGVSTAKGFCDALEISLLSVNTLEAMVLQILPFFEQKNKNENEIYFCPMLDARRMEVYCTILDKNMKIIVPTEAKIIDETSFSDILERKKIVFFGNGAEKCKEILKSQKNAIFISDIHPSAKNIGTLAFKKFEQKQFEDVVYFEPFYLKDFVGNITKKRFF
jgi:tRNA threonylcarbamoyladenosine biosynthesis protein TsaB